MHAHQATAQQDPFYRIVAGVALAIVVSVVVLTPPQTGQSVQAPAQSPAVMAPAAAG